MAKQVIPSDGTMSDLVTKINANFTELYEEHVATAETTYAYIATPAKTTLTKADTYYLFASSFTNILDNNFTVGAGGIVYDGAGNNFEIEFQVTGEADETSLITVAIALNATFDGSKEMTAGTVILGSPAGVQTIEQGSIDAYATPHSLSAVTLEAEDVLSLVIKSSTSTNGFTPTDGCASIHRFR